MMHSVYDKILSALTNQASFEISFTPAWKGYETRSTDADSEMVEGKLPEKLKHLKLESVKLNHHEKLKIYGVSNRIDFKTSGQRNVCQ